MTTILSRERDKTLSCTDCSLCKGRTQVVYGEGNENAHLMFIGEAPGETEDQLGRPFVGKSGQYLRGIIEGLGGNIADCYITNIVKCRPPNNRLPEYKEIVACWPKWQEEVKIIKPRLIVTLGVTAMRELLNGIVGLGTLRGQIYSSALGSKVMPTWHPSYILRYRPKAEEFKKDIRKALEFSKLIEGVKK